MVLTVTALSSESTKLQSRFRLSDAEVLPMSALSQCVLFVNDVMEVLTRPQRRLQGRGTRGRESACLEKFRDR